VTDAAVAGGGGVGSEDGGEEGEESVAGSVPTRNTPEPLHLLRFPLLGPTRQEALMFLKAKNRWVRNLHFYSLFSFFFTRSPVSLPLSFSE
jgi:hypothetical protein